MGQIRKSTCRPLRATPWYEYHPLRSHVRTMPETQLIASEEGSVRLGFNTLSVGGGSRPTCGEKINMNVGFYA